jgi:DNA-directed RNA polymerase specialized sigma24 family protein
MPSKGSVTRWFALLQGGDSAAVEQLWQRYFSRLVTLARQKLAGAPRRVADEEDVALSAFDSLCKGMERGRFPELNDRDGLWRLLVVITARKASHLRRDQGRAKRGGGQLVDAGGDDQALLAEALSREPDPAFAALAVDLHRHLMGVLKPDLHQVALLRMQGESVEEIAVQVGVVPRSIKRKLETIREIWKRELDN